MSQIEIRIPSAKEQVIPQKENTIKIVLLLAMILSCFWVMSRLAGLIGLSAGLDLNLSIANGIFIAAFLLLATFSSMLMLAMAILAHDGVHRVLFKNPILNDSISGALSILGGVIPFYANRQYHLTHHSYTHQGAADPEHTMHNKPFWQALTIGSFIGLYIQYRIFFKSWIKSLNDRKYLGRALKDTASIIFLVFFVLVFLPILGINPLYSFLPAFLIFPFTFTYRAMLDHYGLPRVKRKSELYKEVLENSESENNKIMEQASQQVSGWVVTTHPFIEWLWSSVNYHEVHHKFPYLSHKYLKAAYAETKGSYPYREAQGYTRSLWYLRDKAYYEG